MREEEIDLTLDCVKRVKTYYSIAGPVSLLLSMEYPEWEDGAGEIELTYNDVCKLKKHMEKHGFAQMCKRGKADEV